MILNPRQALLIDEVRSRGSLAIDDLATRLGVTPQTVRRDVQRLAEAGLLARFHGGAGLPPSTTENVAWRERRTHHAEGKRAIARAVAAQIADGMSLFLNIGTTVEAVARELVRHRGLRVVTNNLHVAMILAEHPDLEVIVAGGLVRPRDCGVVGEATIDLIRQFKVDVGLIGISAIEADGTLRDFDWREVRVARAIIEQSRRTWLVADHGKFGRPAMVELARLDEIERLYTDRPPPEPFPALLADAGVDCVVADARADHPPANPSGARTDDMPATAAGPATVGG